MLPNFLLPEGVIREDGEGPAISLESSQGKPVLLTLGITRIIEQESLDVSIWGSPDSENWGAAPLISYPQKFYCGIYQLLLDLSQHPGIQYLRARYKVKRWGHGDPKPLFGVYLFAEQSTPHAVVKTA